MRNLSVVIVLLFSTLEPITAKAEVNPNIPPGKLIHLGMQVMYLDCRGEGLPTVFIDVGLGESSASWINIAKEVSKETRICLYDRGGYGWSDPGLGERTTAQIVNELNQLINTAKIPGPFVLVGHSFGGFTARYFATKYPEKTVGLVLIDSSHPEQIYRLSALDGYNKIKKVRLVRRDGTAPDYLDEMEKRWHFLNSGRKAVFAQMSEMKNFEESAMQVKYSAPIPDIPLAVLTRGKIQLPEVEGVSMEDEWIDMQKDLLNLSRNSWHEIIKHSGHDIYRDAPDEVVKNILKVIEQARNTSQIN